MVNNLASTFSEVIDILDNIEHEYKKKIPNDILIVFENECDKKYLKYLKKDKSDLKNKNYSKDALTIIAYLNLKYWCKSNEEKRKYRDIYLKNI